MRGEPERVAPVRTALAQEGSSCLGVEPAAVAAERSCSWSVRSSPERSKSSSFDWQFGQCSTCSATASNSLPAIRPRANSRSLSAGGQRGWDMSEIFEDYCRIHTYHNLLALQSRVTGDRS